MFNRLVTLAAALALPICAQTGPLEQFEKKIRPVLVARCMPCHASSSATPQARLTLDTSSGIERGGRSGAIVVPGAADRSLLMRAIRYTDKELKMPPGKPLSPEEVADFELWIRQGAKLPQDSSTAAKKQPSKLWSLQKPQRAAMPDVKNKNWVRQDIDFFILQKLESKGLTP